jgi:hypothetical protein
MNIYFACSITGGRKEQRVYQIIVDTLLCDGHVVPTAHLSGSDVMALEEIVDPLEVFTRDIEWINGCQVLIAEVSTPSHGKSVLCLYQQGRQVSKMLTGNNNPSIQMVSYQHPDQIPPILKDFLAKLSLTNN